MCWPQFNDMGPLSSHGFARNTKFTVKELSESRVVMQLTSADVSVEGFPSGWTLSMTVAVSDESGGTLKQAVRAPPHAAAPATVAKHMSLPAMSVVPLTHARTCAPVCQATGSHLLRWGIAPAVQSSCGVRRRPGPASPLAVQPRHARLPRPTACAAAAAAQPPSPPDVHCLGEIELKLLFVKQQVISDLAVGLLGRPMLAPSKPLHAMLASTSAAERRPLPGDWRACLHACITAMLVAARGAAAYTSIAQARVHVPALLYTICTHTRQ